MSRVIDTAIEYWRRAQALNRCGSPEARAMYQRQIIKPAHSEANGRRKELLGRLLGS